MDERGVKNDLYHNLHYNMIRASEARDLQNKNIMIIIGDNQNKQEDYSMARDKSEQKTVNTSIRLTAEQKNEFEKRAKAMGIKPSSYIVNAAFHADELKPETKVKMQNILNLTEEIVREYAPEKLEELKQKGAEIWYF